jgi:hypothetical protein
MGPIATTAVVLPHWGNVVIAGGPDLDQCDSGSPMRYRPSGRQPDQWLQCLRLKDPRPVADWVKQKKAA